MKTQYTQITNEVTGKAEFNFLAKLVSISEKVLETQKGKKYKVGTLEFHLPSGELVQKSTQIFEASYQKGMRVGILYLSTLSWGDNGNMYIRTSSASQAGRAEVSEFEGLFAGANVPAEASAEEGDVA